MKKIWIILINVLLIFGIFIYVFTYSRHERKKALDNEIETFLEMTVAMEHVTANYLETEQGICDAWARYINSEDMTIEQAISFVKASQKPDIMVQILFVDQPVVSGLSTAAKTKDPSDFTVTFWTFDLIRDYTSLKAPGEKINMTRSYTNPINGAQSIAFCNQVWVKDNDNGPKREALLMRILSLKTFEKKWVFPTEEYDRAEIALIDTAGNYIIKGSSFKNTNFFEFYKSYNQTDYAELDKLDREVGEKSGTFPMLNSRGVECLIAHTPINAAKGWALISMVPLSEIDQGSIDWRLIGFVAAGLALLMAVDMSLLMRFNRELQITAREADTANRAKTDFLSTMSHDIRTPMNAIIGLTTIAEKNAHDPEAVTESLHKISLASNHLLTLINDILDISKVESGKLTLSPVSFSIAETAENLVNISQPMVKEKNIDFNFRISPIEHEYLYADQLRLNQIFINILSNAIKYTEPEGRVTIDMKETPSQEPGKVHLMYKVTDNGIGMTPEFLNVLFDPFEREVTSSDSGIQGTGLGMPITKNIVELMHGEIHVTSQKGKGSHFVLRIPMKIVRDAGEETKEDLRTDFSGVRTLLCEDNPINMEIASAFLKKYGFILDTAVNGKEAVDKLNAVEEGYYDLVLMDIQMPIMDGYEACKAIRNGTRNKDVKIIAMTANAFKEDKQRAYEAGMNGHIGKPIDIDVMLKTIDDVLKG